MWKEQGQYGGIKKLQQCIALHCCFQYCLNFCNNGSIKTPLVLYKKWRQDKRCPYLPSPYLSIICYTIYISLPTKEMFVSPFQNLSLRVKYFKMVGILSYGISYHMFQLQEMNSRVDGAGLIRTRYNNCWPFLLM